jgi:chaperonin cofactor prefoldin
MEKNGDRVSNGSVNIGEDERILNSSQPSQALLNHLSKTSIPMNIGAIMVKQDQSNELFEELKRNCEILQKSKSSLQKKHDRELARMNKKIEKLQKDLNK